MDGRRSFTEPTTSTRPAISPQRPPESASEQTVPAMAGILKIQHAYPWPRRALPEGGGKAPSAQCVHRAGHRRDRIDHPEVVRLAERRDPGVAAPDRIVPAVRMPVDARGLALSTLAVVAAVFALDWAQKFVISLLLGILIAYTLNPPVVWLEKLRIPRGVAALLVMLGMVGMVTLGAYSLRGQLQTIVEQVPEAATKFSAGVARLRTSQIDTMQKMQTAATEVEKATAQAATGPAGPKAPATHVVIDQPNFRLSDFLWVGSKGAAGALGQATMVLFL